MFSFQDSLWLRSLIRTFANSRKVYPSLANGVTLTTAASAWTLGNFIEIIPANAITKRFRVDTANFAAFSIATTYEIVFYKGESGSEIEIGRVRANPGTTSMPVHDKPVFTELIDANTRISAKAANSTAGAGTVVVSITYHTDEE